MTLLWLPIDLPKFPVPNFELNPDTDWAYWKFKKITNPSEKLYQQTDFLDEIKTTYPEVVDWFKLFPYKNIRNIKFNHQIDLVGDHIDFTNPNADSTLFENNSNNEPCGYRILIKGKRTDALYIVHNDKKIYVTLPEDTDVYVLGHTSVLHGVDADPGRLTIFTHFEIDEQLHRDLINKSLTKYSQYSIRSSTRVA